MDIVNDKLRKELERLPNASELIKKIEQFLNTPYLNPIFLSIKHNKLSYSKRLVIVVFECKETKKWKTVNYLLLNHNNSWHLSQGELEEPSLALHSILYQAYESPSDGFLNMPL